MLYFFEVQTVEVDFLFFLILEEMHLLIKQVFDNSAQHLLLSLFFKTTLMSDQQEQEWIVVKPRKKKRIEKQIKPERVFMKGGKAPLEKSEESSLEEEYLTSNSYKINKQTLFSFCKGLTGQIQIHCLGLGNFSLYMKSYLQLLFFKHNIIQLLDQLKLLSKVNIYDPVFSQSERKMIQERGWMCDEFKTFESNVSYIFFMPHSQRFLLEKICSLKKKNVKEKPWIIISNSINDYIQRSKLLGQKIPEPFIDIKVKDIKILDFRQAFNDTFIFNL